MKKNKEKDGKEMVMEEETKRTFKCMPVHAMI